jgi:hypothetical protein
MSNDEVPANLINPSGANQNWPGRSKLRGNGTWDLLTGREKRIFAIRMRNSVTAGDIVQQCSYNKIQQYTLFLRFIFIKYSTCFGQTYCPSSGVSTLYTQQLVFVMLVLFMCASEVRMEPAWRIPTAVYTVLIRLMMGSKSVRNMESSLPK